LSFQTVVYRATGYERPLWAFPNTTAGRWNPANSWPAQYLSLHPMTPWAEVLRRLDLRRPEDAREMRLPIWAIRVTLGEEPLHLGFREAGDHGVTAEELVADDWSGCQRLAARLRDTGVAAIVVPSAALPGTDNVVVLRPAIIIDYHAEPIDLEDQPAAMVAQHGRCPEGLWRYVHYRRSERPHAALQAYREGTAHQFEQPAVNV
jgi:RES domain-containing protein